jgi:hypothetical protein
LFFAAARGRPHAGGSSEDRENEMLREDEGKGDG